ncbi:MAG: glutamine--tRNA ligase/YqeY domain fusion protein, partial [Magnetococcales bacterium]|nr:glutamine--tRNA ligase/YqeY domain fusion protein [Magnetococcales bacterium]
MTEQANPNQPVDFIRQIVADNLKNGVNDGQVVTRFPPEPNGYLHIGHAKSICLNFGIAQENAGGRCHLRYDDTNPLKEDMEYINSIEEDVRWLGFQWYDRPYFASEYFEQLYQWAEGLIKGGKAFVCQLSAEEMRAYRGTLTEPGRHSPYRDRPMEESLDLFRRMRKGEFAEGSHVLRAKIDMASPNINMRDPILYRIRHTSHHQTGDAWCIYPTYDYAHPLSDAIEGITHSLCTLEFEDHRPFYDWVLEQTQPKYRPRQIEFARLQLENTVMSKRKLNELVRTGAVAGWDDPRMPTIAGMRRRGYSPAAIREFCRRIGIARSDNRVEMALLEDCVRDDLDRSSRRVLAVLRPLKVILDNVAEDQTIQLEAAYHPKDAGFGSRTVSLTREIWIEQEDFQEVPQPGFKRLIPGGEVRLRHAYVIRCHRVEKDPATGEIIALHATCDLDTLGKNPEGRKVSGVIHWVSASRAMGVEVRLYDRLFS